MLIRSAAAALVRFAPRAALADGPRGVVETYRGLVSPSAGVWQVGPCGADRSVRSKGCGTERPATQAPRLLGR